LVNAVEAGSRVDAAWRALAGVLDPELPVLSVLDLGIVRGVSETADGALDVVLTPTYSGCPAVEVIETAVIDALAPHLHQAERRQFAPAWTTDWISDEGRRKLRDYGIAPPGRATVHWHAPRAGLRQAQPERDAAIQPAGEATVEPERYAATQPARDPARPEPVEGPAQAVACPRCGSGHTERLSAFGATACKALWRCLACREPFEHFKPL
jgi:ring-1,2-phenylacetyl-CoA epoxidase subunit PaaD